MKYFAIYILLVFASTNSLFAQLSSNAKYQREGIAFEVPDGWSGHETEEMIVLGSETFPGMVMVSTHQYSKMQFIARAKSGIYEGNGTSLKLDGLLEELSSEAVGGEFAGTLEWEPAKAYIISVQNPKGSGIMIMAVSESTEYSKVHQQICQKIFNSVQLTSAE